MIIELIYSSFSIYSILKMCNSITHPNPTLTLQYCPPHWVKEMVKPVATLASANKEINKDCNSNFKT